MNSKTKTVLGILLFVVFIGAAAFAYNILSDRFTPKKDWPLVTDTTQQNTVEKTPAPDFTVIDSEGNEVKLSDFFGKPIVLNFWASWCPPCKAEMPHFEKIYPDVKVDIVFLMVDLVDGQRETLDTGKKFIADTGYTFPVYFDTKQEAAYAYGITSIPSTFLIDKDGNIVKWYQGGIDEETLLAGIELIKE